MVTIGQLGNRSHVDKLELLLNDTTIYMTATQEGVPGADRDRPSAGCSARYFIAADGSIANRLRLHRLPTDFAAIVQHSTVGSRWRQAAGAGDCQVAEVARGAPG